MASPSTSTGDGGEMSSGRKDYPSPASTSIGSAAQNERRIFQTMEDNGHHRYSDSPPSSQPNGGEPAVAGVSTGGKPSLTAQRRSGSNLGNNGGGGTNGDGGSFECNICLELANDPVITLCGHLFCWPCLYRWLQMHVAGKECPVCKAGVDEDKVIPLYGRGNPSPVDPRKKTMMGAGIPARPQGQRTESTRPQHQQQQNHHHHHQPGFGFMAGGGEGGPFATTQFANFTLSAGFGLFPSLFGLQYQFPGDGFGSFGPAMMGGGGPAGAHAATPRAGAHSPSPEEQNHFLSKLLLLLGSFVIVCLLLL